MWADAAIYVVYLRSFADSGISGEDGVGDLRGVTSRVEHLADLGGPHVSWLSWTS